VAPYRDVAQTPGVALTHRIDLIDQSGAVVGDGQSARS
jgi:hypothetical protein